MKYILGIDVGTSSVKAVLFDEGGREVYSAGRASHTIRQGNTAEQDMLAVWENVKSCIRSVAEEAADVRGDIVGIGITGQGEGCWLVDQNGQPLRNAILWCDGRAAEEVAAITRDAPEIARLYHKTVGCIPLSGSAMMLLKWMSIHQPEILERAFRMFNCKDWIRYRLTGVMAGEISDAFMSLIDAESDTVAEKLQIWFTEHLNHPAPYYYAQADGTPKQFAFCPIRQYGDCERAESFGQLLDMYYTVRDRRDAMRQKGQAVRKTVQNLCNRLQKKLLIQEKELEATYDRERLRQLGDILTANIHRIKKGQTTIDCEDFYDENMGIISVPLSPILSPQQNAAKFYKDYAKLKNAEKVLTEQLEIGENELSYLKSVLEELDRANTEAELEEIRRELQEGGYIKADPGKKRMKQGKVPPMRFESTDGYPIYVGRNNRQNDELTFKLARKDDIWLHASKVHGSHVIISCGGTTPPDDTITQAAQLAAYYAETKGGQNLPVDVTPVKQVKKPANGKPGMVIYHTYRTVIANPYPDIVVDALNAEKKEEI